MSEKNEDIQPTPAAEENKLAAGNSRTYESITEYAKKATPFTMIAFRGGDVISGLIRLIEKLQTGNDEFSHVGILITAESCPFIANLRKDRIYVWKSTMSFNILGTGDGVADASTGKQRFGVQIRDLEELLPKYLEKENTAIAYCELLDNPWNKKEGENIAETAKRRKKLIKIMESVYWKYHQKYYEFNIVQLLSVAFPCLRKKQAKFGQYLVSGIEHISDIQFNEADDDFVFCSEFVTLVYQALQIVGEGFKSIEVCPTDFFGNDVEGMPRTVNDPVYLKN